MKRLVKRILSLLMVFIMTVNLIGVVAFAEDGAEAESDWTNILKEDWSEIPSDWTQVNSNAPMPDIVRENDYLTLKRNAFETVGMEAETALTDVTSGGVYTVEFRARVNNWTYGPGTGAKDCNSMAVQLWPGDTTRLMFSIEAAGARVSSEGGTWANTFSYPEGFDAKAWHTWKLACKSADVEVYADDVLLGTAAFQTNRSESALGIKIYNKGHADEGYYSDADLDYVKVYDESDQEVFSDEFYAIDESVWVQCRCSSRADKTALWPEVNASSVLQLFNASPSASGIMRNIDLSEYEKVKVSFDAKVNSYTSTPYTTLGFKTVFSGRRFMFAVERDRLDFTSDGSTWGGNLSLDEGTTSQWQHYSLIIDTAEKTVEIYLNDTYIGSGSMAANTQSTRIEFFCSGSSEANAADAYLDNLTISYYSAAGLPAWQDGDQLTVSGNTTTGFTISWPAAENANCYLVKVGEADPVQVTETTHSVTGLTSADGYQDISITAVNDKGNSTKALTGRGKAMWDSASENMDVYQVMAGKNNGGDSQYTNYRIPGIVVTNQNTVIMYYEARTSASDWASMDILAFRSVDGGETWGEPIMLAPGAQINATMNNPIMIVGNDNTLHFLYCVEYGICSTCNNSATSSCTHGPGVYYRKSTDDGLTWSDPVNISDSTAPDMHNVIAVGPGHGICLSNGTLIASVWFVKKEDNQSLTSHHPGNVTTLYSTDNGDTWKMGQTVPNDDTDGSKVADPNETMVVECSDGSVMLNIRSGGGGYRALAWSPTGYSEWTTMEYDKNLIDPTCMGSVNKYNVGDDPYTILLVNCESKSSRSNLVLKGSTDDGKTWTIRKVIEPGTAGYSDVAVDSNGTIYVLYEVNAGTTVNLARLNYNAFIADAKTALSDLRVSGASEELVFVPGTQDYLIKAVNGDTVIIQAVAQMKDAVITINGKPYTSGTDFNYEVAIGSDPVVIKVTNDGKENTYTIRLVPSAPAGTMVMYLNGESFLDQTIYQNNAIANAAVVLSTEKAAFGISSYKFNGNNGDSSRMDVSPTNGIDMATENFAVSAWYYVNSTTNSSNNQQIIFWYGGYSSGLPQFWCRTNGKTLQCNIASGGVETTLSASDVVETGVWQHVVIVRDGVHHLMYLNGELVASKDSAFVHNVNGENGLTLGISRNPSSPGRVVDGYLDEIKIFNYALSSNQIKALNQENTLPNVPVEGVELNKETADIQIGTTLTLNATLKPINADEKGLSWSSSNEAVATVDKNGTVTAVAPGTATITVTTTEGGFTAACSVTVKEQIKYQQPEPIQAYAASLTTGTAVKVNFLGDSITYGQDPANGSKVVKQYHAYLADLIQMDNVNYGIQGSTLTVLQQQWGGDPFTIRHLNMRDDADIVFVFGGTNDYGHSISFGTWEDTEDTTFLGGLRVLITGLIEKYPDKHIVFMTPIPREGGMNVNSAGKTLSEYADAIKKMCEEYNVPVIDAYSAPEMNLLANKDTLIGDGLHPSAAGHEKMANWIYQQLQEKQVIQVTTSDNPVKVEGVALDKTEADMKIGSTLTLKATLNPINADEKGVIWSSSDENVVTVDNSGKVTAVAYGTATITVTAKDGGFTAACRISVREQSTGCPVVVLDSIDKVEIVPTRLSAKYTDVKKDAWYYEAVDYMIENGYMNGISDTQFDVNGTVTRAQLVTILYRMKGAPSVEGLRNLFADVDTDTWYTDAVLWAAANGIINGVSETEFAPGAEVTREQVVTILYRLDGENRSDVDNLRAFDDAPQISAYAQSAMNWAVGSGLVNGVSKTKVEPRGTATRAQICTILMRYTTK